MHPDVIITNHRAQSLKITARYTSRDIRIDIFERTDDRDELTQLYPDRPYVFQHPKHKEDKVVGKAS